MQREVFFKKSKPTFINLPIFLAIIALTVLAPVGVKAHPHCFILNSVRFVFDSGGLAQIRIDWEFDEFFTGQILADCDKDADGKLSDEEKNCIKTNYFGGLETHGFFTFIKINGRPIETPKAENLKIDLIENKVLYQFTVPCRVPIEHWDQDVRLAIYDPTFYCAMNFPEQIPVMVENEGDLDYGVQVYENPDEAYYYGQIHPWETALVFCQSPCSKARSRVIASGAIKDESSPSETTTPEPSPEPGSDQVSLSGPPAPAPKQIPGRTEEASKTGFNFKTWIFEKQRGLYERMAVLAREIKEEKKPALWRCFWASPFYTV